MFFAGWDGGATKTTVRLVDEAGALLSESSFGPLNPNGNASESVRDFPFYREYTPKPVQKFSQVFRTGFAVFLRVIVYHNYFM